MNTPRALSPHNPRENTIDFLITKGLGYCCESLFFSLYSDADLIAARLGVTVATVRRHKLWLRQGKLTCRSKADCQLVQIQRIFSPGADRAEQEQGKEGQGNGHRQE